MITSIILLSLLVIALGVNIFMANRNKAPEQAKVFYMYLFGCIVCVTGLYRVIMALILL